MFSAANLPFLRFFSSALTLLLVIPASAKGQAVGHTLGASHVPAALTPAEVRQKLVESRKLSDDPVAAVKQLLALPPATDSSASFAGNLTAIAASPGNGFAMVRETDCSLTAFNAMYTLSATSPVYNYQSRTFNYERLIHAAAGLTTTSDQFGGHCADPGIGVSSNSLIYAGQTPTGLRVGALTAYQGFFTIVSKEDGTLVGITKQPPPTTSGHVAYSVVSGDLNKDGTNDLVTVNYGFSSANAFTVSITVLLGNPDGSFTVGQTYTIPGGQAQSAVIDDFDGDGKLDLVVPSEVAGVSQSSQITFLHGNGDGTFGTPKTLAVTSPTAATSPIAEGLVSGDFNGDGKKDLVSGFGIGFIGNGDGTFTQLSGASFPAVSTNTTPFPHLAVGDFNKDGKLDVAASSDDVVHVFLGKGDGTFAVGNAYASIDNQGYVTATDLDGDGNVDLFLGDATNGIFGGDYYTPSMGYALMGNGDGSFRGAPQPAGTVKTLQDLNGDGKLDYIAVTAGATNTSLSMQTYLGRGDGTFSVGPSVVLSPFSYNGATFSGFGLDSFALIDLNGDGHLDLVALPTGYLVSSPSRPGYLVALGNADGSFQAPTFVPFPSLIPGGGQDYLFQVTGLFAAKRADGKSEVIYSFMTQDFNNNYFYYQGYATQVSNGDGTLAAPVTTDTYMGATSSTTALSAALNVVDVNGDKTPDLITYVPPVFASGGVMTSPGTYQVSLGKADGTFGAAANVSIVDKVLNFSPNVPVTVADVNGDGKMDLLAFGTNTAGQGEIGIAQGNGDGTFQTPTKILLHTGGLNGSQSLAVADFTGDGKADLVILGYNPPYDSGLFPGNGDGTFQSVASGQSDGTVAPAQPINLRAVGSSLVVDINGDGKPDIGGATFLLNQYGQTIVTPPTINTTTMLMATPPAITVGQSVTLTATVAAASGSGVPTGTVTFLNGTSSLGTGTLNGSGVATLTTTGLSVGSLSITASYGGDTTYLGSTSTAAVVAVTAAKGGTTTSIAASPTTITVGQTVNLTATVVATSGSVVPTGTVTFVNGTTTLGMGTLNGQGVATLGVSTLAVGTQSITASYGGSASFNGSTSGAAAVTVNAVVPADFSIGLSPMSATVTSGSSTSPATVTITPAGGFNQAVALSCSGLPAYASCGFGAPSLTPSGGVVTTTVTIATGVSNTAQLETLGRISLAGFSVLGSLLLLLRRGELRLRLVCLMAMMAGIGCLLSGCGSSKATGSGSSSKTPAGTYTVNVTGVSGSTSHSASFTLVVQ